MKNNSFEARLARLGADPSTAVRLQSQAPKAKDRRERLALALRHLQSGGVTGDYAYSKLFRGLARIGIIVKPLHYWSWVGLIVFSFLLFTFLLGLTVVVCLFLGHLPRPVRGIIDAGPTVFVLVNLAMSFGFAAVHKLKAGSIGLPRWRDL